MYYKKYILNDKDIIINSPFASFYRTYYYDDSNLKEFILYNISMTPPIRRSSNLFRYIRDNKIDAIVVGSDQVWREEYSPCITDYFLGFLPEDYPVKRLSYAASFGLGVCDISAKNISRCIELLKLFNWISIREKSGNEIIEKTFHTKAFTVLDPTLLLDKQDYNKLIEEKDKSKQSGLVYYILDENESKTQIINDATHSLGLSKQQLSEHPRFANGKLGKVDSVSFWLASIANSSFVITDSFHGCVFSIIFNKPFFVIVNNDRGCDRFISLLEQFGLRDRLVSSFKEYLCKKEIMLSNINYEVVNIRKDKKVEEARSFLDFVR